MPKVSIVMTSYNRAPLLAKTLHSIAGQAYKDYEVLVVDDGSDEGATEAMCDRAKAILPSITYLRFIREPGKHYSNPSKPINYGLKRAQGELTILQNAEVYHHSPEVIKAFVDDTKKDEALFATVPALNYDGSFKMWYIHPTHRPNGWFFCGALRTQVFHDLRGMDEDYLYYGMDDVDFSDRLLKNGNTIGFSSTIVCNHQDHGVSFKPEDTQRNYLNQLLYQAKSTDMAAGKIGVVRNPNGWGEL